jgi:histone deacetylase 1/2
VTNATLEIIWVQSLLTELEVKLIQPPCLWCDNSCATYLSANRVSCKDEEYGDRLFYFVREREREFSTSSWSGWVTKPLPSRRFEEFKHNLNLSKL